MELAHDDGVDSSQTLTEERSNLHHASGNFPNEPESSQPSRVEMLTHSLTAEFHRGILLLLVAPIPCQCVEFTTSTKPPGSARTLNRSVGGMVMRPLCDRCSLASLSQL